MMSVVTDCVIASHGQLTDFSAGPAVTLATLACWAEGSEVHLFGFNWSPKFWEGHDTAIERRVLMALADAGQLKARTYLPSGSSVSRSAELDTFRERYPRH
jgi:hypothetical protein